MVITVEDIMTSYLWHALQWSSYWMFPSLRISSLTLFVLKKRSLSVCKTTSLSDTETKGKSGICKTEITSPYSSSEFLSLSKYTRKISGHVILSKKKSDILILSLTSEGPKLVLLASSSLKIAFIKVTCISECNVHCSSPRREAQKSSNVNGESLAIVLKWRNTSNMPMHCIKYSGGIKRSLELCGRTRGGRSWSNGISGLLGLLKIITFFFVDVLLFPRLSPLSYESKSSSNETSDPLSRSSSSKLTLVPSSEPGPSKLSLDSSSSSKRFWMKFLPLFAASLALLLSCLLLVGVLAGEILTGVLDLLELFSPTYPPPKALGFRSKCDFTADMGVLGGLPRPRLDRVDISGCITPVQTLCHITEQNVNKHTCSFHRIREFRVHFRQIVIRHFYKMRSRDIVSIYQKRRFQTEYTNR